MEVSKDALQGITDYFVKVGSYCRDSIEMLKQYDCLSDKADNAKTASVQVNQDKAIELAERLAAIRLSDGSPMIEGYAMLKQAEVNFLDPNTSLPFMEVILDTLQQDRAKILSKTAGFEPGRPYGSSAPSGLSALEELAASNGVVFNKS